MMNSPRCLEDLKEGAIDFDEGDEEEEDILKDFDRQKFIRGQQFFQNHVISCLLAMTFSLVCGLSVNNLLEVLVATGKSSKPKDSLMRYMRTALHVIKWHYGEIWNRNTSAGKSIRAVRQMHDNARQLMVEKSKENGNYNKKVWVSQYDMSLVQCGFMGTIVMYAANFGIKCSKKDVDDYVYFWMWVGRFLGIQDRNNICLGGYDEAYRLCKQIETNVLFPALKNPPAMFKPMVDAFIEGEKKHFGIKIFSPEAIFMLTFEAFGKKWDKQLSISDRLRVVYLRMLVNSLYYIPGFSWCTSRLCAAILGWSRLS